MKKHKPQTAADYAAILRKTFAGPLQAGIIDEKVIRRFSRRLEKETGPAAMNDFLRFVTRRLATARQGVMEHFAANHPSDN